MVSLLRRLDYFCFLHVETHVFLGRVCMDFAYMESPFSCLWLYAMKSMYHLYHAKLINDYLTH